MCVYSMWLIYKMCTRILQYHTDYPHTVVSWNMHVVYKQSAILWMFSSGELPVNTQNDQIWLGNHLPLFLTMPMCLSQSCTMVLLHVVCTNGSVLLSYSRLLQTWCNQLPQCLVYSWKAGEEPGNEAKDEKVECDVKWEHILKYVQITINCRLRMEKLSPRFCRVFLIWNKATLLFPVPSNCWLQFCLYVTLSVSPVEVNQVVISVMCMSSAVSVVAMFSIHWRNQMNPLTTAASMNMLTRRWVVVSVILVAFILSCLIRNILHVTSFQIFSYHLKCDIKRVASFFSKISTQLLVAGWRYTRRYSWKG